MASLGYNELRYDDVVGRGNGVHETCIWQQRVENLINCFEAAYVFNYTYIHVLLTICKNIRWLIIYAWEKSQRNIFDKTISVEIILSWVHLISNIGSLQEHPYYGIITNKISLWLSV